MKKLYFSLILFSSFCLFVTCSKNEPVTDVLSAPDLPEKVYEYSNIDLSNYPDLLNVFNDPNLTIDDHSATLGRVLFYDTKLSVNNRIACGSCHIQQAGFSDGKRFSTGFNNQRTPRNSMSIANMTFVRDFFWDVRIQNLNDLVRMPIENHIEMGMEDFDILEAKLSQVDYYPALFEAAYGSSEITIEKISMSVAQFLRSMVSLSSKYDQGIASNFNNFTQIEKIGLDLYNGKARCSNCHNHPIFDSRWGERWANIGLDLEYEDQGVGARGTSADFQNGAFKIPSLRNISLTGPYMHDGRFNTLEEVVNHYNENIQDHPSLDWRLIDFEQGIENTTPIRLNLDEFEKSALIAFLKTLSDESYVKDEKFSDPFK